MFSIKEEYYFGVDSKPHPFTSLDDREAAICRRFREVRTHLKWKMPDFAQALGITRDRLASYEYARAPIRYGLARDMCERFNVNQRWLFGGVLPRGHYVDIAKSYEDKVPFRLRFSEAYERFLSEVLEAELPRIAEGHDCKVEEIDEILPEIGVRWPVGESLQSYRAYHSQLLRWRLLNQPEEVQKRVYQRLKGVLDELLPGAPCAGSAKPTSEIKKELTESSQVRNSPSDMNSELRKVKLQKVLADVRRLVSTRGMKASLADALGVPRPRISEWLGSKCRPSGETALRLARWVELQERQSK